MKITTTTTKVECNATELRQSNSLAEAFTGALKSIFNGTILDNYDYDTEDDEETEDEEEEEE